MSASLKQLRRMAAREQRRLERVRAIGWKSCHDGSFNEACRLTLRVGELGFRIRTEEGRITLRRLMRRKYVVKVSELTPVSP